MSMSSGPGVVAMTADAMEGNRAECLATGPGAPTQAGKTPQQLQTGSVSRTLHWRILRGWGAS